MAEIEPALTREEWEADPHPSFRGERLGVLGVRGVEMIRYPSGVEIRVATDAPPVFVDITCLHALAALCLDNRRVNPELWPAGFTWEQVDLLREQAAREGLGVDDPAERHAAGAEYWDLADRIAALLPPRGS